MQLTDPCSNHGYGSADNQVYTAMAVLDKAGHAQMLEEAQRMTDQALELQVMAAILGNRLIRLNNPIMATKLKEMKERAEAIMTAKD